MKGTSITIKIRSDFAGPFTLYSLRWEGDYNNDTTNVFKASLEDAYQVALSLRQDDRES